MSTITETASTLERLGFATASNRMKESEARARKMMVAYEHFRFVRQEKIDEFNAALRAKTEQKTGNWGSSTYQKLSFTPIAKYEKIPPTDVLVALEAALEKKCFDSYEIAHIVEVKEDPILFGRIEGCADRFFISQWDRDLKIQDLIKDNEG